MAGCSLFLDWRHVSESQLQELEGVLDEQRAKQTFLRIFSPEYLNKDQKMIFAGLFCKIYGFCKSSAFDWRKTSTLLSIMYEVFQRDCTLTTAENDMSTSFAFFETQLIRHSVESPPQSIKVFESEETQNILTFILERYYRHFKVFSYIFAAQSIVHLEQADHNDIEEPFRPMPLSSGYPLA